LIYAPVEKSRRLIHEQIRASSQAQSQLAEAGQLISGIPEIDDIKLRQIGSFKNYSDTVGLTSKKLNKLLISYNVPSKVKGIDISQNGRIISNVNATISGISSTGVNDSKKALNQAQRLAGYQAAVSAALVNILEYDPVADTASFSPESQDTDTRLKLAEDGLSETLKGINEAKIKYSDPTIGQVVAEIKELQDSRDELASSGDTAAWAGAVGTAQNNIIVNRELFWENNTTNLGARLQKYSDMYSHIERQYELLTDKY